MSDNVECWCGERGLRPFSQAYLRCDRCQTLVYGQGPPAGLVNVTDRDEDLYGRRYWFAHQTEDLGYPSLIERERMDLVERAPHWTRTVLKYKQPPARVLEIGSGPACLLALLSWAGFEVTGVELSPWLVEHSARSFGVDVRRGTVETLDLAPRSFDVVAALDVLEHLADPLATLRRCADLLAPDGVMIVQTPCYPEGVSYEALVEARSPFLQLLVAPEHLFLFSKTSIAALFGRLGMTELVSETPIYPQHDMYFAASRVPVPARSPEVVAEDLGVRPGGRLVRALLDAIDQVHSLEAVRARLGAERDEVARAAAAREQRLREVAAEMETLQSASQERLELLRRTASALEAESARRAELETAARERLEQLEATSRALEQLGDVERRRREIEAAAEERLALLHRVEADRAAFAAAADERLELLLRVDGDRAALEREVARLREALDLRDRRVVELERALDRASLQIEATVGGDGGARARRGAGWLRRRH